MELQEFLQKLNPQFALGHTSYRALDCAGLIILWLREQGYKCEWETQIKRDVTSVADMEVLLGQMGFVKGRRTTKSPRVAFWEPNRGSGHLGIYEPVNQEVIHMTPWGIRVEKNIKCTFWFYEGE